MDIDPVRKEKTVTETSPKPSVADLGSLVQFAQRGIVSKTVYESATLKMVLFCFEKGQALSEHAAPFEAVIHVLQGSADIMLGGEHFEGKPGSLFVMPEGLLHALVAKEQFVFLLSMVRVSKPVGLK